MTSYISQVDGALMLEFGNGDLAIACGGERDKPIDELIIYAKEPGPIGDKNLGDIGKPTTEVKTLVRMVFHDVRSLDVLIHQISQLRDLMSDAPKWTAAEHDNPKSCLIQDNDSHWYVIPADQRQAVEQWLEWLENHDILKEEYDGPNFDSYRVDGPQRIVFGDWKEV